MSNRPNTKPTASRRATASRVQQARQSERTSRVPWIIGGAVALVLVVLVVAVALTRKSDTPVATGGSGGGSAGTVVSGGLSYGTVKVTGTPLPAMQPGATGANDPAVGQVAPTLQGVTMSEQPITIGNDGKPKVVMFLAHWCPHCQAEVPKIEQWLRANGMPADVQLYAVATGTSDQRPNFPPAKWLQKEGWTVPTMVDDQNGTAADAYGLSSFPFFVAVDANGKVVARTSGELELSQFEALLAAAKAGGSTGTVPGSGAASPGGAAASSTTVKP
ncbi:MAG: TlpA disulfide reductase family protein [Acidimicrobiales bacterium]